MYGYPNNMRLSESWPHRRHTARSGRAMAALGLILSGLLAGCAHAPHRPTSPAPVPVDAGDSQALNLLTYARRLAETTPAGRRQAVIAARRQMHRTPGAVTYAYLALALARPHQRLYTPDEAARYARLALAADDAHWSATARLYLSDTARLLEQATTPAGKSESVHVAALEKALAAARAKLAALSNIEDQLDTSPDSGANHSRNAR